MVGSKRMCAAFLAVASFGALAQKQSEHLTEPGGLDGWIELTPIEGYGDQPTKLIVRRNQETIREFPGDPLLWHWLFLSKDQVAYEAGTLHTFNSCIRADIRTGRKLEVVDCAQLDIPNNTPAWVKQLRAKP